MLVPFNVLGFGSLAISPFEFHVATVVPIWLAILNNHHTVLVSGPFQTPLLSDVLETDQSLLVVRPPLGFVDMKIVPNLLFLPLGAGGLNDIHDIPGNIRKVHSPLQIGPLLHLPLEPWESGKLPYPSFFQVEPMPVRTE